MRRQGSDVAAGAELARGAGTAFDPEVVASWFRVAERCLAPSSVLAI